MYEWAASRASVLLAQRPCSAAHSVRTGRLRPNSDVATRPRTTVEFRRDRRVQLSRPSWAVARAVLIAGADLFLLSVAALSLFLEKRRSSPHCTCSQKFIALPLLFSRCRATSVTCLRACERPPSQRALLVWVGRHLVLRLRTVGAIASSCNRWNSRSLSCNSVSSAFK